MYLYWASDDSCRVKDTLHSDSSHGVQPTQSVLFESPSESEHPRRNPLLMSAARGAPRIPELASCA
jgi:hypothetical protein